MLWQQLATQAILYNATNLVALIRRARSIFLSSSDRFRTPGFSNLSLIQSPAGNQFVSNNHNIILTLLHKHVHVT